MERIGWNELLKTTRRSTPVMIADWSKGLTDIRIAKQDGLWKCQLPVGHAVSEEEALNIVAALADALALRVITERK